MSKGIPSWENYWSGVADVGAYSGGGVNHPSIDSFWKTYLSTYSKKLFDAQEYRILDVCAGNGALISQMQSTLLNVNINISAIDYSESAIRQIEKQFPHVQAIVADASAIPFNKNFKLIISQFGIEYAGKNAFAEVARVTEKNGTVALMMHIKDGVIYRESIDNIRVINKLNDSDVIEVTSKTFVCGIDSLKTGNREDFEALSQEFAEKVRVLEGIMHDYGKNAAGGLVIQFYNDIANIYENLGAYDADELERWLMSLRSELLLYRTRMESMVEAALDSAAFDDIITLLKSKQFTIEIADMLFSPNQLNPLAWVLVAHNNS
ncbi:class I SAM-dependent methyltransferase [Alteromonas gracilis]|uniref:class I SAM-dependent methyltransferase n=1 Tax=Alteromonas gracilis TaxID=1479524 RepID=UPI002FE27D8F